ncbi:MAG TPA: DNA polymerase III subunit epsilon [Beijerinckiaceae bacterium]
MTREIVLDTETTGLDPATGDRIVEIGCVEMVNSVLTGRTFHVYLDPERDLPEEAFRVHGLSREFLTGKPKFGEVAQDFVSFIADARLVIHNAEFDIKFINAELNRCGLPPVVMDRVLDTLHLARRKHPGASNTLDALCARYRIDNSKRTKHGALLDAEILAEVYVELNGGRQTSLILAQESRIVAQVEVVETVVGARPLPLGSLLEPEEAEAHRGLTAAMGEKSLWRLYEATDVTLG